MSNKLLFRTIGAVGLTLPILITLLLVTPSMAQRPTLEQITGALTVGNFSLVYDFSDFATCVPECLSITILYDSSNNELTYIKGQNVVNITHLDDGQEKILAEALPYLRYLNYTDSTCKLYQPYCIANRLKVTSDLNIGSGIQNHTTISEWSFLSPTIISNAEKIASILYKSAEPFIPIANNQTNANNMTSLR